MRTLLVTLVLLIGTSSAASGQALLVLLFGDKLSTEKFQIGINAAVNWSGQSGLSDGSTRFSWSFGAYGEVKLSEHWRLQPEITLKTPAGAEGLFAGEAGNPFELTGDSLVDAAITSGRVERNLNYISVPVVAKYMLGPLGIGAGGYVAFLTGGSDELTSDVLQGALRLKESVTSELNTVDAGLVATLEYSLKPEKQMRSIKIAAKLYWGLTNTVKDNPGSAVQNRVLFVGLGIPVGGKKAAQDADGGENGSGS
jgi:hypothetical protein